VIIVTHQGDIDDDIRIDFGVSGELKLRRICAARRREQADKDGFSLYDLKAHGPQRDPGEIFCGDLLAWRSFIKTCHTGATKTLIDYGTC
jgi:hypothetical protein